ncbi:YTH domain-containing protein ECT1 [Lactuca sativa]|uniref:YTH domain-containing protein ECT1 n=1 Tax=Lactuca sativa TaxID=4236 RepID=UPI000CD8E042|nr:YTH domain-containing protein ECT1 [Lactuca sativa]XP_023730289.1 YTH domain-containing protein ECT1 [Lactuca sativa]XP_023730290.1 YTH domain-containing protein ECT1 [Lactuca sativa]
MPGDKKIVQSDSLAKRDDQNLGSRKDVIVSGVSSSSSGVHDSSAKGGVGNGNKAVSDQGAHYSSTSCYDYQYPGHNGTYSQLDVSGQMNSNGAVYSDNGSLLYYMPSYNPYATGAYMGVDAQQQQQQQQHQQHQQQQQPYFSSSEAMPCYSSFGAKSVTGSNGMKANDLNSKRTMNFYTGKSLNYPLDMKSSQHSTPSVPKSILQSQHFRSLNKLNSAYQSGGLQKGYQQSGNFSSFSYPNQALFSNYSMNYSSGGRLWNENERYKPREKSYNNGESEELTRGPRAQSVNSHIEEEKVGFSLRRDKYNLEEFQTKYDHAKFYVIKSYSEDDVHKSIKYDVWSSTPNGNKKLDAAYRDAEGKTNVFLFFSVNGSGQFVGVAEMIGSVDYEKNMDFWQLDKWNGFFPVKWHVVKDVPNTLLRHIILENNDNRPVTYTRDTQEVGLKQGLEMLEIFKSYSAKTSLLDDLSFYENREKMLKAKRISKAAFQTENLKSGESNGLKDPTSSLINLTRNLSINSNTPKSSIGDNKSGS